MSQSEIEYRIATTAATKLATTDKMIKNMAINQKYFLFIRVQDWDREAANLAGYTVIPKLLLMRERLLMLSGKQEWASSLSELTRLTMSVQKDRVK